MKRIEEYPGLPEVPEDDLRDLEDIRMPGSCDWFTDRTEFQQWLTDSPKESAKLFWVHAKPATGKSVLSSHIITTVDELNYDCSYYFFRYGDKIRSTSSGCLLSLLWQMAMRNPFVRGRVLAMMDHGVRFERDNAKSIWRKLVEPVMTYPGLSQVQYWVIDALDECSEISHVFAILSKLEPTLPLKVFITSRRIDEISQGFSQISNAIGTTLLRVAEIQAQDTRDAIALYLETNKHKLHVGTEVRGKSILSQILQKSQGCFLWVRLVLEELSTVWTLQQVEQVLQEVPQEMDLLYSRALEQMASRPTKSIAIARAIIMWTLCAIRPMLVDELQSALQLDIGTTVQDPYEGIPSLCAQLVHVDRNGRVLMVHLTAKTFLQTQGLDTNMAICPVQGHQQISKVCLEYLVSEDFKPPKGRRSSDKAKKRANQPRAPFANYAAFNFAEHMRRTTSNNTTITPLLYELLGKNVFTWIEMLAASNNLYILTRTADVIKNYQQRQVKYFAPLGEQVQVVDQWAVDLPRLVAKFGNNLVKQPSSIHWLIPPFCPESSAVAMVFGRPAKRITVVGLTDNGWDDRLACIDSQDTQAYAVANGEGSFAISFGTSITLCHATTCQQWKKLEHGTSIRHLRFDPTGNILVSVGRRDLKVWDLETNIQKFHFDVGHDVLAFSILSGPKGLVVALKNSTIIRWNLGDGAVISQGGWEPGFEDEGHFRRPPMLAAFSPDETILAIAYRGRPIKVWDLEDGELVGYLGRETHQDLESLALGANTSPSSLAFNTDEAVPLLAVAYEDGDLCLFDYEDLRLAQMIEANAQVVCCSPSGTTLATGNSAGMVQLLEFETLQLLFKVNAVDYGVRCLAFSSDNTRFFDVRGTQCNVWEPALPSAKTRKDDASSTAGPAPPRIVGMSDAEVEITTVATDATGDYFFIGKSDGTAWLYRARDGKPQKLLYRHGYQMSLAMMVWGEKGCILVTADIAGRFIAYRLQRDPTIGFNTAQKTLDIRGHHLHKTAIAQILLSPANDLLLVSTHEWDSVWDLQTKTQLSRHEFDNPRPTFDWTNNPADPSERVLLDSEGAAIWDWLTSQEKRPRHHFPLTFLGEKTASHRINSVTQVFDAKKIALEVVEDPSDMTNTPTSTVVLLDASTLSVKGGAALVPSRAFADVCNGILHLVGTFGQRAVFLDKQLFMCSVERRVARQDSGPGAREMEGFHYVKHFFIPSDWYSQRRTLKTRVTAKGDVLFVRAEEVAVIKHGLAFEGDKREVWEGDPTPSESSDAVAPCG
jgi:WD40 repeat protein